MATAARRTPCRRWLPFAVAALAAPAVAILSPRAPALIAPALACTGMPELAALPSKNGPLNTRVIVTQPHSMLGTSPRNADLSLREAATKVVVPTTLETFGPARTDIVPSTPLAPGREYEAIWTYDTHTQISLGKFTTSRAADAVPPVLGPVGAPKLQTQSAKGTSSPCSVRDWTEIPVVVTDASPVTIAVWEADGRDPDLAEPPFEYSVPAGGRITVHGFARLYRPDPKPSSSRHPGEGRRYALMAIDAAGNRSEVVFTPGGKRVPAVTIASPAPANTTPPDASESDPQPTPEPASSSEPPDTTAVDAAPDTPQAPAQPLPRAEARGGCAGCTASPSPAPARGRLLLALAAVALAVRRRARPR